MESEATSMDDATIRDEVLNDLQEQRSRLGETSSPVTKRAYKPRVYSRRLSIVPLLYTFILGMLFFPAMDGQYATFAAFTFILAALVYSILKE